MAGEKRFLLVDAEALDRARRELRDMGKQFVENADLRDFASRKGLNVDLEAARITTYVRALTPQSEGGGAYEIGSDGADDETIMHIKRLTDERDALRAEVERLRRVLRGKNKQSVLAGARRLDALGFEELSPGKVPCWDSTECAFVVLVEAGRAAGVVEKDE